MPLQYATTDQFADYSPGVEPPSDPAGYLRAASRLVAHATRFARFTATPSGLPEDAELVAALRDATCEQASAWAAAGVDPVLGVVVDADPGGELVSATVTGGPRTVTEQYTPASAGGSSITPSTVELTPQAWLILHEAGLTAVTVRAVRGGW